MSGWQQSNLVMRTISDRAEKTGVTSTINALRPGVDSITGSVSHAVDVGSKFATKTIVEPVLGDAARASHKWATEYLQQYRTLKPKFVQSASHEVTKQSNVSPAGRSAASDGFPLRMFNLRTRNLEDVWIGRDRKSFQYAILSHGWKGQEIEYTDIMTVRALAQEKDVHDSSKLRYPHLTPGTQENPIRGLPPISGGDVDMLITYYESEMDRFRRQRTVDPSVQRLTCEELRVAQKRRSAYKIMHSLERAIHLFHEKFQKIATEKLDLYLWNDTCCINKTVVSEHVNSLALMGEWYTNAEFCIVHLDIPPWTEKWDDEYKAGVRGPFNVNSPEMLPNYTDLPSVGNAESKPFWSTRGWTLQELCLSRKAYFYNNKWELLPHAATPAEEQRIIAKFSGVPQSEVCRGGQPSKVSAFELLGFASQRNCTVECDRVYSMMGMLGVKFLAFHAEGLTRALSRLLDEVVGTTHDVSIFNWDGEDCGSTIPGRSLYPATLDPFSRRSKTFNTPSAHFGTADNLNDDPNAFAPKEVVLHSLRLIDKHLERFAYFISQVDYDCLPNKAIACILEYTRKATFGKKISFEYELVRKILRFVERADQRMRDKAENELQQRLQETIDTSSTPVDAVPANPPPPYNQVDPAAEGKAVSSPEPEASLYDKMVPSVPSLGLPKFGMGKKKDKGKPTEEKPVEKQKTAGSMFSSFKIGGGDSGKGKAEDTKPKSSDADKESEAKTEEKETVKLDSNWYTLVENVVAYLTSLLDSPETADPHRSDRLKFIGKILDALHRAPTAKPQFGALDFEVQRHGARYLDQILANRVLCYVVQATNLKDKSTIWNMEQVLRYIKRTDFETLSPILIDDLLDLLNRTPFCACPDYGEIVKIHMNRNMDIGHDTGKNQISLHEGHDEDEDEDLDHLPAPMISRNPVILSNSGIEGLFDIQRVVVDILEAGRTTDISDIERMLAKQEKRKPIPRPTYSCSNNDITGSDLYRALQRAIGQGDADATFTGRCKISTGLGHVTVRFCCTASMLKKQLDIRDILTQTELSGGPDVMTMLNFVQETDIELVAGEWVLARFAGVPGANWFLCLLELGATHPFYGWRIPTEKIDFTAGTPEPGLVKMWEDYMEKKKNLLCGLIDTRIQQRRVVRDKRKTQEKREKNAVTFVGTGLEAVGDVIAGGSSVIDAVGAGLEKIGKMAESETMHAMTKLEQHTLKTQEYRDRIDLRFKALEEAGIEQGAHMAVLGLDDNSVLPAMFFAAKRIHMF